MAQSNIKEYQPKSTPEFIAIDMKNLNISNFNLNENKYNEQNEKNEKNIQPKPTINISKLTNELSNEFREYLIDEAKDYNLPLPVGIKETSQTTRLTNLVKKSISSTFHNISESLTALNSPNENSPK
jgi:O6-methylguanine-DNA--protein-cysteine methyltransferase